MLPPKDIDPFQTQNFMQISILLSIMIQFYDLTEIWVFATCPNRNEPPKSLSYLKHVYSSSSGRFECTERRGDHSSVLDIYIRFSCLNLSDERIYDVHNSCISKLKSNFTLMHRCYHPLQYVCYSSSLLRHGSENQNRAQYSDSSAKYILQLFAFRGI